MPHDVFCTLAEFVHKQYIPLSARLTCEVSLPAAATQTDTDQSNEVPDQSHRQKCMILFVRLQAQKRESMFPQ